MENIKVQETGWGGRKRGGRRKEKEIREGRRGEGKDVDTKKG